MHHDEHFLDRTVSRLSLPAMERSMVLYNDSQLTRFILELAKLPEDNRDVAIALAPGDKPEHTIVRRDGHCRTNLASGWPYHDAHLIPYQRLESLLLLHDELKRRFKVAEQLTGEKSSAKPLLLRLLHAGRYLCREEFDAISYWQPFCRDLFIDVFPLATKALNLQREQLRKLPPKHLLDRDRAELRRYWEKYFLLRHLAFLIAMDWHRDADRLAPSTEKLFSRLTNGLFMNQGSLGGMLCLCWVVGELGKDVLRPVKQQYLGADPTDAWLMVATSLLLLALAARRPKTYAQINQVLDVPFGKKGTPPEAAGFHRELRAVFNGLRASPPSLDPQWLLLTSRLFQLQRAGLEHQRLNFDAPLTVLDQEWLPCVAASSVASLGTPTIGDYALLAVPQCVKLQPRELYFPSEVMAPWKRDWQPTDTVALLSEQNAALGKPEPIRAEATPGRNDPCTCGNGKKYKKCHGA
ncbi:MAG TPA: SEC-C metal-binding domain-containing protein [Pseudomonadota bacterium]|jgi:hypothetical protein|nr:SEC-C metal-binding domain-containing protein [Pseudomonadota bacterium]